MTSKQVLAQSIELDREFTESIQLLDKQFKQMSNAAKEVIETVAAENHSVEDLQSSIGTDTTDLLLWVQESIRWVPYTGALKGAQGTLLAKQGNMLDQSLLLHALMTAAGHQSRVMRAPREQGELNTALFDLTNNAGHSKWSSELSDSLVKHRGLFARLVSRGNPADATSDAVGNEIEAAVPLLNEQLAQLRPLLPELMVPMDDDGASAALIDTPQQAFWVQVESPDGHWLDFSVDYGENVPQSLKKMASQVDPTDLPVDLQHVVQIQVELDIGNEQGNLRSTEVVFDYSIRTHELPGQSMVFQFQPSGASSVSQLADSAAADEKLAAVVSAEFANHNAWVPTLVVDRNTLVRQRGFTSSGDIFEFSEELLGGIDKATQSQLGDAVSALQLGDQSGDTNSNQLIGVRIVWTIRSPQAKPRRIERSLFRTGQTVSLGDTSLWPSLATSLSRQSEILIQTGLVPWSYVEKNIAEDYLQQYFSLRYLLGKLKKAQTTEVGMLEIVDKILSRFVLPKEMLVLAAMRTRGMPDGYFQEPNILTSVQHLHISKDLSDVIYSDAIDIVHSQTSYFTPDATQRRHQAGVWDNIAEQTLRGRANVERNTTKAFSGLDSSDIKLIKAVNSLDSLVVNAPQREIMMSELSEGYWLAASDANTDSSRNWWRINPATGNTIGQSMGAYDVGGAAISETTVLLVRFQIAVLGYMIEMAKCSNSNRGNSHKALNCAICSTIVHSLKMIALLKVGGDGAASVASDASGLSGQICKVVNQ